MIPDPFGTIFLPDGRDACPGPASAAWPARGRVSVRYLAARPYGRTAPSKVLAYQPVFMGSFWTFMPVCGASMM